MAPAQLILAYNRPSDFTITGTTGVGILENYGEKTQIDCEKCRSSMGSAIWPRCRFRRKRAEAAEIPGAMRARAASVSTAGRVIAAEDRPLPRSTTRSASLPRNGRRDRLRDPTQAARADSESGDASPQRQGPQEILGWLAAEMPALGGCLETLARFVGNEWFEEQQDRDIALLDLRSDYVADELYCFRLYMDINLCTDAR
jgi:hypothetical protein